MGQEEDTTFIAIRYTAYFKLSWNSLRLLSWTDESLRSGKPSLVWRSVCPQWRPYLGWGDSPGSCVDSSVPCVAWNGSSGEMFSGLKAQVRHTCCVPQLPLGHLQSALRTPRLWEVLQGEAAYGTWISLGALGVCARFAVLPVHLPRSAVTLGNASLCHGFISEQNPFLLITWCFFKKCAFWLFGPHEFSCFFNQCPVVVLRNALLLLC